MEKFIKAALLALPLIGLGACTSDEPEATGDDGQIAEKSEVRYLKVNLVNASGNDSRVIGEDITKDYADGTEAENKIRTLDFYLYDADKNYHSHVDVKLSGPVDPTKPTTASHVHGFYETNVPVSLVQGEKLPQYVICIVNAVHAEGYYEHKSMAQAQKDLLNTIYGEVKDGDTGYFAMNNSVYYGLDVVTGLDNQLIMATPFDTNKLLTMTELDKMDQDKDTDAIKDATVDIYVERYAAKVNFSIDANAVQAVAAANDMTLTFEPQAWDINSYEKSFYFLKSYREDGQDAFTFASYDTMNGLLFGGWNRPDHFRSFWSRTPGYYANDYPIVADDILDLAAGSYPYATYYQSYSSTKTAMGTPKYVIESTNKGECLTGANMPEQFTPMASIPAVILVGQYTIGSMDKPVTFYTYQKDSDGKPYIYSATDGAITGITTTIHDQLLSHQTVVLKKKGENSYARVEKSDLPTDGTSLFAVKHPEQAAREGLKIGGDVVTLQIEKTDGDYYFYDAINKQYSKITAANKAQVNRLLYQNLGGAHAYVDGKAFFTAPIQHWGWYRSGNENAEKPVAEWDWTKMKTGDFGVVRNHIYNVQISKIGGLGTGIISDDDPLLPPTDKVSYAVKFRVNIQKWATLPVQKWEW